jgi:hypothetical protein
MEGRAEVNEANAGAVHVGGQPMIAALEASGRLAMLWELTFLLVAAVGGFGQEWT